MGPHSENQSEFQRVIARIEAVRDAPARSESFERFRLALEAWGYSGPKDGKGVILVVGTNGKGSVAKTLETLIAATGRSVGLFTSPHMIRTTERIRSHGCDLSEEEFVQIFKKVEPVVSRYGLSHFETLTLMMVETFFGGAVRPPVEWAVLEAGVGGRLDPTRLIPHETTVVTQLGLDHQDILGPDLSSIARQKFAAVDPGNLVVYAPLPREVRADDVLTAEMRPFEASIFSSRVDTCQPEPQWILETPWGDATLALLGERGVRNTSVALSALEKMGFEMKSLLPHLRSVKWPCRMERFEIGGIGGGGKKTIYLSGDHNPQGVESLIEILSWFKYRDLHLLIGVGKNKPAAAMVERFRTIPRVRLHLTTTPFRSADGPSLKALAGRVESICVDPLVALNKVLQAAGPEDLVVVSGSLYLTGYLRGSLIRGWPQE